MHLHVHRAEQWRLIVRLKSRRALREYAEFHKLSGRALAKKAGLKPAIVGHLMAGRRETCNLATARKIEEALGCPSGFLFEPAMSPVADTKRREPAA
jgi:transcriptional regulator with XRE-family HTH domain